MEDCARAGKRMIVFDRVNPIGAIKPQGTVLDTRLSSFVGRFATATRHNLTVGEYARFINESENIGCDLTVAQLDGWTRDLLFRDTTLDWVSPSPNIKTPETCFYYIGTCLAEGLNLSEGRGTEKPFELIGAPWLDSKAIAEKIIYIHSVVVCVIWPIGFVIPNSFRAASDVKYTMMLSVISMWIFRVGLSYVFAYVFHMGIFAVWTAMFCDWGFRAIFFGIRYLRGTWLTKYKEFSTG
jgi:hypothetical protein